jgi:hypothetical protein
MTVKLIRARSVAGFFGALEEFSQKAVVFRGHRTASWRLTSTLSRHHLAPYNPRTSWEIDEMIRQFLGNLKIIGIDPPYAADSRRSRLEFARHYGVPSPLIDFSYSPYIASFFAFSGVRPYESKDSDQAAIYCLNLFELASVWAKIRATGFDLKVDGPKFTEAHNDFMYDNNNLFENDYPAGVLKFLDAPASWNRRMRRQLGCFLYDSLAHPIFAADDLEHFMGKEEIPGTGGTILTKVLLPHKLGRGVLERLDLMGINATHLYDSHEGAAIDVVNSYNYDRKSGRVWDLKPPLPPLN